EGRPTASRIETRREAMRTFLRMSRLALRLRRPGGMPTSSWACSRREGDPCPRGRGHATRGRLATTIVILLATAAPGHPRAQDQDTPGATVDRVGFDQKLGIRLPLDRRFRDDSGRELALGELFGRRPVILVPVYYRCPLLCNQTLNALTRSLKPLS